MIVDGFDVLDCSDEAISDSSNTSSDKSEKKSEPEKSGSDFSLGEKRLRVLVVASDCNPKWHSLPALIAEYCRELAKLVDLTLVTHIRNQENLDPWLPAQINVHYIDTEKFSGPLHRFTQRLVQDPNKAMTLQVALSVPDALVFEYQVWKEFKNILRAGDFDIVHRASPMSPTIPSYLASKSPVPFVIGPVLGGLPWPKEFKGEMRREGEWMNYLRKLHRLVPYYKSTYQKASAILAGYKHTAEDIPLSNRKTVFEFSEGAIHPEDYPKKSFKSADRSAPNTVLFVGRMVPFKQPEILIRCFEKSGILKRHRLVMVGDGPEYERLKGLVNKLELNECITLTGALPIDEVRAHMCEASIFAFPSIREQGGGVITMASMASLPSVVVDYGGPSYRVPSGCGVKVPMGQVDSIIEGFTQALEGLVENSEKREKYGSAARDFTERYYSWAWKAQKTVEIYRWVLGQVSEKPNYWEGLSTFLAAAEEEDDIYAQASRISF